MRNRRSWTIWRSLKKIEIIVKCVKFIGKHTLAKHYDVEQNYQNA